MIRPIVHRKPVGFWASSKEEAETEKLPWPGDHVHLFWDEAERQRIIAFLKRGGQVAQYRGWSTCRLCGIHNGSQDLGDEMFVWPQGYAHYVDAHHVKPPQEFLDWVLRDGLAP